MYALTIQFSTGWISTKVILSDKKYFWYCCKATLGLLPAKAVSFSSVLVFFNYVGPTGLEPVISWLWVNCFNH